MSCMFCDNCDRFMDTDYHPSAFICDGELVLCETCMEDKSIVLTGLKRVLKDLERLDLRSQRTDNAYANSGRMTAMVHRMADLRCEINKVRKDFEKWLGNQ